MSFRWVWQCWMLAASLGITWVAWSLTRPTAEQMLRAQRELIRREMHGRIEHDMTREQVRSMMGTPPQAVAWADKQIDGWLPEEVEVCGFVSARNQSYSFIRHAPTFSAARARSRTPDDIWTFEGEGTCGGTLR
jgi:hypothetical protein